MYKGILTNIWRLQIKMTSTCIKNLDFWKNWTSAEFSQWATTGFSICSVFVFPFDVLKLDWQYKIHCYINSYTIGWGYIFHYTEIWITGNFNVNLMKIQSNLIIPTFSGPEKSVVISTSVTVTGVGETYVYKKLYFFFMNLRQF